MSLVQYNIVCDDAAITGEGGSRGVIVDFDDLTDEQVFERHLKPALAALRTNIEKNQS